MKYHFKIHKEEKGFWAECLEIPGCVTQGDSEEELFANMQEAVNMCLEEPENSENLASLPREYKVSRTVVAVPVDPTIAFGFILRYHRLKSGLTQKEAARRLGMKNIFSYQRLERGCNATLSIISKLVTLFPHFSLDSIFDGSPKTASSI